MGWFKKQSDPFSKRQREINQQIADLEREIARISGDESPDPGPENQVPPSDPSPSLAQEATPAADPTPVPSPEPAPEQEQEREPEPDPDPETSSAPGPSEAPQEELPGMVHPKKLFQKGESVPNAHASGAIPKLGSNAPKLRSTTKPNSPTVPLPSNDSGQPAEEEATDPKPGSPSDPIFEEINPFRPAQPTTEEKESELGIRQDNLASTWQRMKNHIKGPATNNPKLVNYLAAGSIQGLRPLRYERRVARNRFILLVVIFVLILWGIMALLIKR